MVEVKATVFGGCHCRKKKIPQHHILILQGEKSALSMAHDFASLNFIEDKTKTYTSIKTINYSFQKTEKYDRQYRDNVYISLKLI